MTNTKFTIFLILILGLFSCEADNSAKDPKSKESPRTDISSPEQLYGTWKISQIDTLYLDEEEFSGDEATKERERIKKRMKSRGYLYSFFPENVASVVEAMKYNGASWTLEGTSTVVNRKKEGMTPASQQSFKNIQVYNKVKYPFFSAEIEGLGIFQFRQVGSKINNPKEDPYHPINNQWRVTATKSETYDQMRQRLYNYTQHCHYLFKSSMERDMKKVFTANTASIFKYYDGAIGLVDGGKVPSAWLSNFYSPDEAMDTWAMAKKYFKNNMIRGKKGGDYVSSNEEIFRELLSKIKADL